MRFPAIHARVTQALQTIERAPYHFLSVFFLALFIIFPLTSASLTFTYILDVLFYCLLLLGTRVLEQKRGRQVLTALCLGYILLDCSNIFIQNTPLMLVTTCMGMVNLSLIAASVFFRIYNSRQVDTDAVLAGMCVFLFIGLVFNEAYALIEFINPGSFDFTVHGKTENVVDLYYLLFYFSFMTQMTVGYGDVLPLHPFTMSLSVLQGVIGQFYIVIFIARLVSLNILSESNKGRKGGGEE